MKSAIPKLRWHINLWLALLILFVFLGNGVCAQGNNIWYFGYNAGIDFTTTPPTALQDGALYTNEGCATLTDEHGNLLMYTDGVYVYNRLHQQMPNGFVLLGHSSSTQSALIAPLPGSDSLYYIFTTGAVEEPILHFAYSVVDMSLENGMGDVITKNIVLSLQATEQLNAVRHANGSDLWVMTREFGTNNFNANLLTSAGINFTPVVSSVGPLILNNNGATGQLKFSPNGDYIAQGPGFISNIYLYDFDNSTGLVSNERILPSGRYGIEFSPSGRYLYASRSNRIYQWDLGFTSLADIIASRQEVFIGPITTNTFGAMQLARNGKIYVARFNTSFLGVIESPESPGISCSYNHNGIDLSPQICRVGLPTFIQSFNYIPFSISAQTFCTGLPTQFSVPTTATLTNYQWHFGDSVSGTANTSTIATPTHTFTAPGQYMVTLTASAGNSNYTQTLVVDILPAPAVPVISPAGPLQLCAGTAQNLQAAALPGLHYQWLHNNQPLANDTLPALTVSAPGSYQLLVSDSVCSALSDSVLVTVHPPATAQILPQNPPPLCPGQSTSLTAGQSSGTTFSWLHNGQPVSGANGPVFAASSPGSYQVIASYNGLCADTSAAVVVTALPAPLAAISPAVVPAFCSGQTATLTAYTTTGYTYQWLHNSSAVLGATSPEFTLSIPGNYQVVVSNAACSDTSAAVPVTVHPLPLVSIVQ